MYLAKLYCNEFASAFKWNGYEMSSYENAQKAKQEFLNATDTALNCYEEVKDFPKAETRQKLSKDAKFAEISGLVMGENIYSNGKILASNVAITINMLLGMLAGGGIFLLITLLGGLFYGKEAMGFGDVKLMGALGIFFGLSNIIVIIYLIVILC